MLQLTNENSPFQYSKIRSTYNIYMTLVDYPRLEYISTLGIHLAGTQAGCKAR